MSTPVASACRNCGAATGGRFCPECGQETAPHPPTAGEFLHEFVGHHIALEGALWKTLRMLVRPGALTLEYLAGRKRRYVLPLRLYFTVSLVFFLATKLLSPVQVITINTTGPQSANAEFTLGCSAENTACAKMQARIRAQHPGQTQRQVVEGIRGRVLEEIPYAMFFLLPIFAWLTRLAWWKRPFNYGEHLVFALHVHTFAFLVGTLLAPVPLRGVMTLPAAVYLLVAMRRVFGGRVVPLVLRFLLVTTTYLVLVIATISALGMGALFL